MSVANETYMGVSLLFSEVRTQSSQFVQKSNKTLNLHNSMSIFDYTYTGFPHVSLRFRISHPMITTHTNRCKIKGSS